jgi:putative aldouronate transport system substrate-binding protein
MYRWAQAGYYSSDAATNTEADTVQIQGGYYFGTFGTTETDMTMNYSRDCGREMIPINLIDTWAQTSMYTVSMWGIPVTCKNPEKTFRFLNMLYADNDLDNILTFGLEGVTYEVVERGTKQGQNVIRYANGVNAANAPYIMPLHVFGDKLTISVFEPITTEYFKMAEAFNTGISDRRKSATLGYVFNTTPVSTQVTAVSAVVEQYVGMITCGTQRPDTILPEFQAALRNAGVEQVVAENQKQLNTWLAAR